jgi:hypothetical protein
MAQGGGITGFAEGVGVGSGLARSGISGTLLRRELVSPPPPPPLSPTPLDNETYQTDDLWTHAQGSGDTILTGLIPRFVRLSALVALELGREVGAEEAGPGSGSGPNNNNNSQKQKAVGLAGTALVPTVQWYLLLAGLLTCAVFEGYLTAEWRGLEPLQVLLGFGLGGAGIFQDAGEDDDGAVPRSHAIGADEKYVEFEPDGMPDLSGAVDVLFPSRRANAGTGGGIGNKSGSRGGRETKRGENGDRVGSGRNDDAAKLGDGEAEYTREMGQRLARVGKNRLSSPPIALLFCCPSFFSVLRICSLLFLDWWLPIVPWMIDLVLVLVGAGVDGWDWKCFTFFCFSSVFSLVTHLRP